MSKALFTLVYTDISDFLKNVDKEMEMFLYAAQKDMIPIFMKSPNNPNFVDDFIEETKLGKIPWDDSRNIFKSKVAPFSNMSLNELLEKELDVIIYQPINSVSTIYAGKISMNTLKEKIKNSMKDQEGFDAIFTIDRCQQFKFDIRYKIKIEIALH